VTAVYYPILFNVTSTLELIPTIAWRLELDKNNQITWHADINGEEVVAAKEPLTSGWKRFQAWFLKIAPESQL